MSEVSHCDQSTQVMPSVTENCSQTMQPSTSDRAQQTELIIPDPDALLHNEVDKLKRMVAQLVTLITGITSQYLIVRIV